MQKNMKFQVEFQCKNVGNSVQNFLKKMMQKNMKIHEELMKNHTRKPTFEKRGSEVRFLMDSGFFGGSRGAQERPKVVKKGVQEGTQKTMKNTRVGTHRKAIWKDNVSI